MTPRDYPELVQIYELFHPRGFEILAFPSNQFGSQEPGTDDDIRKFADKYGVTFPMFTKINVNGKDADPVWRWLKANLTGLLGSSIKWNFTKFLLDREGKPVKRFSPATSPTALIPEIEALL